MYTGGIVIGIPNNGTIVTETALALVGAVVRDKTQRNIIKDVVNAQSVFVDLNRNVIVREFLNGSRTEWLLFLDSDIELTLEHIYSLYDIASNNNLKVLGGIYFYSNGHRSAQVHAAVQQYDEFGRLKPMQDINFNQEYFEVGGVGTGALLIHRSVLNEVVRFNGNGDPYWFKTYDEQGTFLLGEDVYFCKQVAEAGHKCYATPRVIPRHIKNVALDKDYFINQKL